MTLIKSLKCSFQALRELFCPRVCLICGKRLSEDEEAVCLSCLSELPYTRYCGKAETPLARLFYGDAEVYKANALLFYFSGADSCKLIFAFKYYHRPEVGTFCGRMIAKDLEGTDFFDGIDALVPVPLARKRQRRRGYNQSESLAEGIAELTDISVWTDVVERIRENPTQTHLGANERRKNVEGIFKCVNPEKLRNKHILLVDDVVTTGATLISCIGALRQVEGIRFSVVTLAQAAKTTSLPGYVVPDFDV